MGGKTYPKTFAHKTVQNWIGKTVRHRQPVAHKVDYIIGIVAVYGVQIDHRGPKGQYQHEEFDWKPTDYEQYQDCHQ